MKDLLSSFQDPVVVKRNLQKQKTSTNSIHWTNSEKVSRKECVVCKRGSTTVYECLQCQVNLHPQCMAIYHNWTI